MIHHPQLALWVRPVDDFVYRSLVFRNLCLVNLLPQIGKFFSGERKIIRLRKQFFSPQILETASAYRPKTFLKMKSGEAVEARFFSIRHVPATKRKMSKRQAGHAPNLHSPSPLAARAAFRLGTMAQRSRETLTRCSRHNARDSRISVRVRHGSQIAESRERLVDILSKR